MEKGLVARGLEFRVAVETLHVEAYSESDLQLGSTSHPRHPQGYTP